MATIQKLAIRGIRSFSPDDPEQTIQFYSPLTMIVGQNGCGKTTIIECLKYSCTGKLPPGGSSTSGQSWVHDPKLTGNSEVKAQVKLRVKTRTGQLIMAVRSLQLVQKAKNLTFKQLDGVIKTINADGKKESATHKCLDLNAYMCGLMGVSSAILESVIFCHQEESNWPLQEGATLKKKFDDIFESTRYTKALEAIDKTRKANAETVKLLKVDLSEFQQKKIQAAEIRGDLAKREQEIERKKKENEELDAVIADLENKMSEARKNVRFVQEKVQQKERLQSVLLEKDKAIDEKLKSLSGRLVAGDEATLKKTLEGFDESMKSRKEQLDTLENQARSIRKKQEEISRNLNTITGQRGQLQEKRAQNERLVVERNMEMHRLSTKYNIDLPRGLQSDTDASMSGATPALDLPARDLERFTNDLNKHVTKLQQELTKFRTEKNSSLNNKHAELSDKEVLLKTNTVAKERKDHEYNELSKKAEDLRRRLQQARFKKPTESDLDEARSGVRMAEERHKALNENGKEAALNAKIDELVGAKGPLETSLGREKKLQKEMLGMATDQNRIDFLEKDVKEMKEQLDFMYENFNRDFGDLVEKQISDQSLVEVESHLDTNLLPTSAREVKEAENRHTAARDAEIGVKNALGGNKRELAEVERDLGRKDVTQAVQAVLKEVDTKLELSFGQAELGECLTKLQEDKQNLDHDVKQKDHVVWWLKNMIKKTTKGKLKGCCPLCERTFEGDANYTHASFLEILERDVEQELSGNTPDNKKLEIYDDLIKRVQELFGESESIKALNDKKDRLLAQQQELEDDLRAKTAVSEENMRKMEQSKDKQSKLKEARGSVKDIREKFEERNRKNGELRSVKLKVQTLIDSGGKTLAEVDAKVKQLEADAKKQIDELEDARAELNDHMKQLQKASSALQMANQSLSEKEKLAKEYEELEKEHDRVRQQIVDMTEEQRRLREAEKPLQDQIKKLRAEFESMKGDLEKKEAVKQKEHLECSSAHSNFMELSRKVAEALKANVEGRLAELEQRSQELTKENEKYNQELGSLQPAIEKQQRLVNDHENTRKSVEGSLRYLEMVSDRDTKKEELKSLQDAIEEAGGLQMVEKKYRGIESELSKKREDKAAVNASMRTLLDMKRDCERKLRSDYYRDAEKKFRELSIKKETTDMAVQDLQKYHKALDRALQQYHHMKVEEINKLIRELWQRTYQGGDIEDIAIVSGEEGETGGGRATRSYNYRVVMKKGETNLDMRGRCSAGQRVLASIVIRLALAETFCVNCGIMTLDEPTTNLDHENKAGLAEALARLIADRSRQHNFQLVTITHDEDFVDMMKEQLSTHAGASMPEYYWRIQREEENGRYYSKILQCPWTGTIERSV